MKKVVSHFGLSGFITKGVQVETAIWDEDSKTWLINTTSGEVIQSRFVVSATGALRHPSIPNFKGRDCFKGKRFAMIFPKSTRNKALKFQLPFG